MPKWHPYQYAKVRRSADRLINKEHLTGEQGCSRCKGYGYQVSHSRDVGITRRDGLNVNGALIHLCQGTFVDGSSQLI